MVFWSVNAFSRELKDIICSFEIHQAAVFKVFLVYCAKECMTFPYKELQTKYSSIIVLVSEDHTSGHVLVLMNWTKY